jgi:hypothetical protein
MQFKLSGGCLRDRVSGAGICILNTDQKCGYDYVAWKEGTENCI